MDFKNENNFLMLGDCLERMKEIPDQSVDAIIADPPYGTIKGSDFHFDKKGKKHSRSGTGCTGWDDIINIEQLFNECNRILNVNGVLILFGQEPYTSKIITQAHNNIPFSYNLYWYKIDNFFRNSLVVNKAPIQKIETVSVFFKKYDTLRVNIFREYSFNVLNYIYKKNNFNKKKQIHDILGHLGACHFFDYKGIQFGIPTEKTYNELIDIFKIDEMDGFLTFEEMKEINEKHKNPKVFNLPEGKKLKESVLEYKRDFKRLHPTQKPVALMEDLVYTYTNEGMTVLDFSVGSGSTGVACNNLGRKFIGIEKDEEYFNIALKRLKENSWQGIYSVL